MTKNSFSILVNSTDSFSDCWLPFFTLFNKFWPDFQGKIYLNTETKSFKYENLNIISVKSNLVHGTWSECLKYAIDSIDENFFIYMQEDYFLHTKVNNSLFESFLKKFSENNWDCLQLTDQCTTGPFNLIAGLDDVWEIKKGAPYRLSTQTALWKKQSLKNLICHWESGWLFEQFGTKRSNILLEKVMCVSQDYIKIGQNEIIPYVFTGIIKGRWKSEVVDLFEKNNIEMDFTIRGFKQETKTRTISINKIKNLLFKNFRSFINLMLLKIKLKIFV